VALSILRMPEADRPMRNPDTVGLVATRWSRRIERARRQAEGIPHYLEVRFEELVAAPEAVLRRVCEFIELDFTQGMLEFHAAAGERLEEMNRDLAGREGLPAQAAEGRIAPHALASEPPRRERVGAWRTDMSAEQVAEFEAEGGEMLRELGYELGASA
jgi:Sulfotransferase family